MLLVWAGRLPPVASTCLGPPICHRLAPATFCLSFAHAGNLQFASVGWRPVVCHQRALVAYACHQHVPVASCQSPARTRGQLLFTGVHWREAAVSSTRWQIGACLWPAIYQQHTPVACYNSLKQAGGLQSVTGAGQLLTTSADRHLSPAHAGGHPLVSSDLLPFGGTRQWRATCQLCKLSACHLLTHAGCHPSVTGVGWWAGDHCLLPVCGWGHLLVAGMLWRPAATHRHEPSVCGLSLVRAIGLPPILGIRQWRLVCQVSGVCRSPVACPWHVLVSCCLSPASAGGYPAVISMCWRPTSCGWHMLEACHVSPVHARGPTPVTSRHQQTAACSQCSLAGCHLSVACTCGLPPVAGAGCGLPPVDGTSRWPAACCGTCWRPASSGLSVPAAWCLSPV